MLKDRRDLNLAQIDEKLVVFLLARTVNYQVCAERENGSRHNRENFKRLIAQDTVVYEVQLVNLEHTNKSVENPREHCFQRVDVKLVQVEAHLGLISLQQVFKKLAN